MILLPWGTLDIDLTFDRCYKGQRFPRLKSTIRNYKKARRWQFSDSELFGELITCKKMDVGQGKYTYKNKSETDIL